MVASDTLPADTVATLVGENPWLSGNYTPVHDELDTAELRVTGELPSGLRGAYRRNGGNPAFAPMGRYHLFDGDGMVHAVELDGEGGARYRNRFVESKGLLAERRAARALFGGLSEFRFPEPEVMEEAGLFKNTANTNVVRYAGRILALMEGAKPTELRGDLSTVGEYDFDGRLQGAMTAHPKVDPATGELLFFGYSPFPPYLRYHVADSTGGLVRSVDIDLPRPVMMHDFVATGAHVVFFDLPAVFDVERMMAGGTSVTWEPQHGARIGVLPRDAHDGGAIRWFDLEPFFVFHFLNAWDDADTVVVDGCRAPRMPTAFGAERLSEPVLPTLHRWTLDLVSGRVTTAQLDDRAADFPRVADTAAGTEHRYGYLAHSRAWGADTVEFDGVIKIDTQTGDSSVHVYGDQRESGEAVFAADPDGSAEDDGWLLNLVFDQSTAESSLVVLDARDLSAEPVATVHLPRRVPFGFHGNWMTAP